MKRSQLFLWSAVFPCLAGVVACSPSSQTSKTQTSEAQQQPMSTAAATAAATSPQSVGLVLHQSNQLIAPHQYTKMSYPTVVGTAGTTLNPVIQKWIGARCPIQSDKNKIYPNAARCATAFMDNCNKLKKLYKGHEKTFGCTLDATTTIKLDAAGLLGLIYTTYTYTGGAHGNTVVSYLNLNLANGQVLKLSDMLDPIDAKKLSAAIETAIRVNRDIPASKPLKQADFFVNTLPPTDTVLALPAGLLFTYQSYEIGPYVLGQPHGVVPYAALGNMLANNGPLRQLVAVGKDLQKTAPPPATGAPK